MWLSDQTLSHLRTLVDQPDLTGTRYQLVRELGRGGMGTVYLVHDTQLQRHVALKVLNPEYVGPEWEERVLHEARLLARLDHSAIVPVHDAGRLADGRPFYVMKYIDGVRLDSASLAGGRTDLQLIQAMIRVSEAVAFANDKGILHGDIKPQNILLGAHGEVALMDWGISRSLAPTAFQSTAPEADTGVDANHAVMGTPGFMSPEQALGAALDARSDVYSLGATLYFALTGKLLGALQQPMTETSRRQLPAPLLAICTKATATEREQRYASSGQLTADLQAYVARLPVSAYRESFGARCLRLIAKHHIAILILLTYVVARVLMLLFARR